MQNKGGEDMTEAKVKEKPQGQEKSFESILTGAGNGRQVKHNYLHIGFTLDGEDARVMRQALAKAGVTSVASYVRELVLADLRKRLNGNKAS
jgi:hypothetical protein